MSSARGDPCSWAEARGPDDRSGDRRPLQQPGERPRGRLLAPVAAAALDALHPLAVVGQLGVGALRGGAPLGALAEDAAEQPRAERAPGDEAGAVRLARGQHLPLDGVPERGVEGLLADQSLDGARPNCLLGLGDVPTGDVGGADVDHLPLLHQHGHRLPDLLPGGAPVDVVHLVEVEMVAAQSPQRSLAGLADGARRAEGVVGPVAHRAVELGGDHRPLPTSAALGEPAPDDLLGHPVAPPPPVNVGGVEEGDAQLERLIHQAVGVGLLGVRPTFMVRRQRRLTCSPDRPRWVICSIGALTREGRTPHYPFPAAAMPRPADAPDVGEPPGSDSPTVHRPERSLGVCAGRRSRPRRLRETCHRRSHRLIMGGCASW